MLESLIGILQGLVLVKLGLLIVSALYIAFLLVVFKQSKAMQNVINDTTTSGLIDTIAFSQIVIGIAIFIAALIIL